MKRKLLFVLMLFICLTGFNEKAETSGNIDITNGLFSSDASSPKITSIQPANGEVLGYEGQIVSFIINYTANPGATYKVYRITGGGDYLIGSSDEPKTQNELTVRITNVTRASSGDYKIVLTNQIGSVVQRFNVRIYPAPPAK